MIYNLAEFKTWLTQEQPTTDWTYSVNKITTATHLEKLIQQEDYQGIAFGSRINMWSVFRKLALKWRDEVDEREREREQGGEIMFNFQEFKQWFNTEFPNEEAKQLAGGNYRQWLIVLENPANWEKAWKGKARENLQHPLIGSSMQITISGWVKEAWIRELASLKAKVAEYEAEETSSQVSSESSYNDLTGKLAQKRAELQVAVTGGRRSTAGLRKEIELLERIQRKEERIRELEQRITELNQQVNNLQGQTNDERVNNLTQQNTNLQTQVNSLQGQVTNLTQEKNGWQTQLQQKQTEVNQKQTELTTKTSELNQTKNQVNSLQGQINSLTSEKKALEERVLKERQEALKGFLEEKEQLEKELKLLNEQKDTFQKSADYLRETLKGTEKTLDEVKKELGRAYSDKLSIVEEKDKLLTDKEEELRQRNESFKTLTERNVSLQGKLSSAQSEINQLSEWIGKLEGASVERDAFQTLKKDLEKAQQTIAELQEQLSAKKGKNYWWIYVIIALAGIYLIVK